MCMTWRFHFPLRNYDFKVVLQILLGSPYAWRHIMNKGWHQNVAPVGDLGLKRFVLRFVRNEDTTYTIF